MNPNFEDLTKPTYVVCGVLPDGRRFKPIRTKNWLHATMINVFRGSIWEEHPQTRKRKLLRRMGW